MKNTDPLQQTKNKVSGHNLTENNRKHKSYYEQFLQLLIRKTEAEKRAQIFGMDPFK